VKKKLEEEGSPSTRCCQAFFNEFPCYENRTSSPH